LTNSRRTTSTVSARELPHLTPELLREGKADFCKHPMKETFDKAGLSAEVEVYEAMHGWCPPDSSVYNEPLAEKAWSRLLELYGKALA
jgi:carboxymethylenebutenolidase